MFRSGDRFWRLRQCRLLEARGSGANAGFLRCVPVLMSLMASGTTTRLEEGNGEAPPDLRSHFGEDVRVVWNRHSSTVRMITTGADSSPGGSSTDEERELVARGIFDTYRDLFGYDSTSLVLDKVWHLGLEAAGTTDKVAVTFHQAIDGVDVHLGWASVLSDANGRVLSIDNGGVPWIDVAAPELDEKRALLLATDAFGNSVLDVRKTDLVIYKTARERVVCRGISSCDPSTGTPRASRSKRSSSSTPNRVNSSNASPRSIRSI